MKKTILMLAMVGVALTACEKKDKDYEFKSGEFVYLNGLQQPKFKSTATQYSLSEIVRDSEIALYFDYHANGEPELYYRTFSDDMRDTINNRLLMRAEDILAVPDGRIVRDFIDATNVYLRMTNGDTCGYIPNSVIASAREQIEALYAQERYDEIYELFHTAFTFYTCTGQEYKDIVANGGN